MRNTAERAENMSQKIEDINQKENLQISSIQVFETILYKIKVINKNKSCIIILNRVWNLE